MKIRKFRWGDLPAMAKLMTAHAAAFGRKHEITVEQIEKSWRSPYNHPERDAFVAEASDGQLLGYTIADILAEEHFVNGVYQVLPQQLEAGRLLVEAATNHAIQINGSKASTIIMEWRILEEDIEAISLFVSEGFSQVRQFYTMKINLDEPIIETALPQDFHFLPFSTDKLEAVYAAKVEIFRDHWGEQIDDISEWQADIEHADFDPSLWLLAYKNNELAAMVLSQPTSKQGAWIGIVGVRRAYRKQGLAQILLKRCFAVYQERGYQQIELGVDSESPTNAVALYERVGMFVRQKVRYYRKSYQV